MNNKTLLDQALSLNMTIEDMVQNVVVILTLVADKSNLSGFTLKVPLVLEEKQINTSLSFNWKLKTKRGNKKS